MNVATQVAASFVHFSLQKAIALIGLATSHSQGQASQSKAEEEKQP